jgi:Tat protein translocase TatB subunit
MFDIGIGFSELMLLAVIMIIVVGPEELPAMLRSIGRYAGQVKRVADDFRSQVSDAIKETEIDKVNKPVDELVGDLADEAGVNTDPFGEDLIDFEEHNQKILDEEKRQQALASGEEEQPAPEDETATQRALREAGEDGLQSAPQSDHTGGAGSDEQTELGAADPLPARKSGT